MDSPALTETTAALGELSFLEESAVDVYCWRVEELDRAGYSLGLAHSLAGNCEVDLHLACDLLARGCPEGVAYSILT
jgi:hypothetical protein